jgi:NADH-quinone oxidoreductase subunit C
MTKDELANRFKDKFGADIQVSDVDRPEAYLYVYASRYRELCNFAKSDPDLDLDLLFQLAGVHYPDDRFEIVLCLSSHEKFHNAVIKVKLDKDNPAIDTVSDIWGAAGWYEREAMELFGIKFENHPDPRPLLLYEDWDHGYPMRKGWTGPDFVPMPEK